MCARAHERFDPAPAVPLSVRLLLRGLHGLLRPQVSPKAPNSVRQWPGGVAKAAWTTTCACSEGFAAAHSREDVETYRIGPAIRLAVVAQTYLDHESLRVTSWRCTPTRTS